MDFWKCVLAFSVVYFIFATVDSKVRRVPHRHHRHSRKHNSHLRSGDRKNQSITRKKRSQYVGPLNSTVSSADELSNISTTRLTVETTRKSIQDLEELSKIFGLTSINLHKTTVNSPIITSKLKDIIKHSNKSEVGHRKISLLNLDFLPNLSQSDDLMGIESSGPHVRVKRYNSESNQIHEASTVSSNTSSSIERGILSRKKRGTNREVDLDLYQDISDIENRQRRDTGEFFNDENSIFKNGLEDVYPEAAEDFDYQLPLAKLIRTKRLDNPQDQSMKLRDKRGIKRNIENKKISNRIRKEGNTRDEIFNSLKTSGEKIDDDSRKKRQKNPDEVGYYNDVHENVENLKTCNEEEKKQQTSNIKSIQTRSVQEVKKLAEQLIVKVGELENFLGPTATLNPTKSIRQTSGFEKTANLSARRSPGSRSRSSGLKRSSRKVKRSHKKRTKGGRKKRKSHRKWDRWTDWSSCSVTCGKGRQIRWRHCIRDCTTAETEMEEKVCHLPACGPGKFLGIFK